MNTSTTNNMQYVYDTTTGGGMFLYRHRLEKLIYPNGRTIFYDHVRSIRNVDGNGDPSDGPSADKRAPTVWRGSIARGSA